MPIDNVLASMAVKDLAASVEWYENLFGRPADSTPMPEVAEWKFAGGGWLQIYQLPERAGNCSCTLAVSDVDEEIKKLDALQIDTSTRTANDKVKTVMIVDLDDNHIALAQTLDKSMAR